MVGIGPKHPPSRKGKLLYCRRVLRQVLTIPRIHARYAAESAAAYQGFRENLHGGPTEAEADCCPLCQGARERLGPCDALPVTLQ